MAGSAAKWSPDELDEMYREVCDRQGVAYAPSDEVVAGTLALMNATRVQRSHASARSGS